MILIILGVLFIVFGVIIPFLIVTFSLFGIFSEILGAPFVPTQKKLLKEILESANLKKGMVFLELGSGDGRMVKEAVKRYRVYGIGVDTHLPLVLISRLTSKLQNLKNIEFINQNLFKTSFYNADVIFVFLLPKVLKKLVPKFKNECKKNCLIISHGFKIQGLEDSLIKTQKRELFSTYFYRLR